MRRAVRIPGAGAVATTFLSDTLDWLNLWHNDGAGELNADIHYTEPTHLSPHL
jgi:hypothetical protein